MLIETTRYELPSEGITLLGYIVRRMHKTEWLAKASALLAEGQTVQALEHAAIYAASSSTSYGRAHYQPRFNLTGEVISEADPITGAIITERLDSSSPQYNISYEAVMSNRDTFLVQARLCELEAEIKALECTKDMRIETPVVQVEQQAPELVVPARSAPILYEKEKVGFAFVDNELKPVEYPTVEKVKSDKLINLPLLVSGAAIGEVKIGTPEEKQLSAEEISFANTIAQQASLQIQSLRLIEAAERARVEAEQATRQYMHQNWDSYLDAVHQDERIGYVYDQAAVWAPRPGE